MVNLRSNTNNREGGVTNIGDGAFEGCGNLTSVTIPDGITSIGMGAFESCSSLTSITIPDGVTSIEEYTFAFCSSLTEVYIPYGVTNIGNSAFTNCDSLISINIPYSVTSIGDEAFYGCDNLISITIPLGVSSIGDKTFASISNSTEITIPSTVTSISDSAFEDSPNVVIYCYKGSVAYTYAVEKGIKYKLMESSLSATRDGDNITVTATVSQDLSDAVWCGIAVYDSNDKQLDVLWKEIDLSNGAVSLDQKFSNCTTAITVKLFLLGKDSYAPVCEAIPTTVK